MKFSSQNLTYKYLLIIILLIVQCLTLIRGDEKRGSGFGEEKSLQITNYVFGNLQVVTEEKGRPSKNAGLYISSQEIPRNGTLTSLQVCGYVVDREASITDETITVFLNVIIYHLENETYRLIYGPYFFEFEIKGSEVFGCSSQSLVEQDLEKKKPLQPWLLTKGDRIAVIIDEDEGLCMEEKAFCPLHVNIIDSAKKCCQEFYYNITNFKDITAYEVLPVRDKIPSDDIVFINLNATIEELPLAETSTTRHNSIFAVLLIPVLLLTVLTVILLYIGFYCNRRGKRKCQTVSSSTTKVSETESLTNTYSHLTHTHIECVYHNHNSLSNKTSSTLDSRMTSTPNDYSISVRSRERVGQCTIASLPVTTNHHYEMCDDLLEGARDTDFDDYKQGDEFWEPAHQETILKEQLISLNIKEITIEDIQIGSEIGGGQFAIVHHGWWTEQENIITEVAIKSLKGEVIDEEKTIEFLREAAIMGQFEHPNILQIFAFAFTEEQKPLLIVDLMLTGDLLHHLQSLRPNNNYDQEYNELSQILLSYSRQVAFGMLYLGCKKFVHRDLAARNVLVSNDGTCKIADFGLSRNLIDEDYYISHGGKIPVKWTAPEAIHFRKYSTASDVWSYGCLLYEIWSLGYKPFHNLDNREVIKEVAGGHRLPPPPGCPKAIYNVMIKCWNPKSGQRPSFLNIVVALQRPDFQTLSWSPEEIDAYSKEARSLGAPLEEGKCLHSALQFCYIDGLPISYT